MCFHICDTCSPHLETLANCSSICLKSVGRSFFYYSFFEVHQPARNIDTYNENMSLNSTTPVNVRCDYTGFSKNVPETLLPLCGASELVLIMTKSKYFDCKYCIWKKKIKIQISLKHTIFFLFFSSISLNQIRAEFQCGSQVYLHT